LALLGFQAVQAEDHVSCNDREIVLNDQCTPCEDYTKPNKDLTACEADTDVPYNSYLAIDGHVEKCPAYKIR
jgi:hypothetical protein